MFPMIRTQKAFEGTYKGTNNLCRKKLHFIHKFLHIIHSVYKDLKMCNRHKGIISLHSSCLYFRRGRHQGNELKNKIKYSQLRNTSSTGAVPQRKTHTSPVFLIIVILSGSSHAFLYQHCWCSLVRRHGLVVKLLMIEQTNLPGVPKLCSPFHQNM